MEVGLSGRVVVCLDGSVVVPAPVCDIWDHGSDDGVDRVNFYLDVVGLFILLVDHVQFLICCTDLSEVRVDG